MDLFDLADRIVEAGETLSAMSGADRPVPFHGTRQERLDNFHSHRWVTDGEETVCWRCDCKPWHVSAGWPCGEIVQRSR